MTAAAGGSRVFMSAPATARRMTEAASRFLATLDQSRLSAASFAFTDNGAAMAADERERLVKLIRLYVDRTAEEVASAQLQRIEQAGLESITFAWAGGSEPGQPHYYAIEGPTFVIEYDKTQDGANHIHSVLRDFTDDWGEDLLAAHYAQAHRASAGTAV